MLPCILAVLIIAFSFMLAGLGRWRWKESERLAIPFQVVLLQYLIIRRLGDFSLEAVFFYTCEMCFF